MKIIESAMNGVGVVWCETGIAFYLFDVCKKETITNLLVFYCRMTSCHTAILKFEQFYSDGISELHDIDNARCGSPTIDVLINSTPEFYCLVAR